MTILSIVHVLVGLLAVVTGSMVVASRKGDLRHRWLGWAYVGLMLLSLTAIVLQGFSRPRPFHGFAVLVVGVVIAAVLASRFRRRLPSWRSWHGALMSFSMLAAAIAIGGVVGGLALGLGNGPTYYRMFDVVIAVFTVVGLAIINTRPVIWGRSVARRESTARWWFSLLVLAASSALVLAQWLILAR